MTFRLDQQRYSLSHEELLRALAGNPRFLFIQDLDGVCMGLVPDPKQRVLDRDYIRACKALGDRFFVLTNGEHTGSRGVNLLVDQAFSSTQPGYAAKQGLYLPGLGAGGVQFQDCFGSITHPGVSDEEMKFLQEVPHTMTNCFGELLSQSPFDLGTAEIQRILDTIVLDNAVSPTVNIGSLYDYFSDARSFYRQIQSQSMQIMSQIVAEAGRRGLAESFFIHLAPNLGSPRGVERLKPATDFDMGTTDFQLMLRGAVKEVGVVVLLNHYYFVETGEYPLGSEFNARNAPGDRQALLALVERAFDPDLMPRIIGVGDTITSSPAGDDQGATAYHRGGSDRGFLTLVQELGRRFATDNAVIYTDSSRGALKRPGIEPLPQAGDSHVDLYALRGVTDTDDPLKLNFVFPGGHSQYTNFFIRLARHAGASVQVR